MIPRRSLQQNEQLKNDNSSVGMPRQQRLNVPGHIWSWYMLKSGDSEGPVHLYIYFYIGLTTYLTSPTSLHPAGEWIAYTFNYSHFKGYTRAYATVRTCNKAHTRSSRFKYIILVLHIPQILANNTSYISLHQLSHICCLSVSFPKLGESIQSDTILDLHRSAIDPPLTFQMQELTVILLKIVRHWSYFCSENVIITLL